MKRTPYILLLLAVVGLMYGCSDAPLPLDVPPTPEDLVPYEPEDGKADGYSFNPHMLIEDLLFEDANFLTEAQIQSFLENTPYRRRSFLADYAEDGVLVSRHIYEAAQSFKINPLVLLTKLQVESSVVFKEVSPQDSTVDHAMGCGCHDGDPACSRGPKGVGPQIRCAASLFRGYLNELDAANTTRSGWRVSRQKSTLDEIQVIPNNRATAALYTYTPWVLQGRGGNWLFWNVYHRFARQLLKDLPNHRFIGGPCQSNSDCAFRDGICLVNASEGIFEGSGPVGVCSQPCERACPDRQQPNTTITFCMDTEDGGQCVPRCNDAMFPNNDGCDEGMSCTQGIRPNDETRVQDVCYSTQPEG